MPWQLDIVQTIRVAINDLDTTQTYTDSRLQLIALVAAQQVLIETDFDNGYLVDIANECILPDPSDMSTTGTKDMNFMALVAMKSAVLISRGELKAAAGYSGISLKDGPSSLDTSRLYETYSGIYKQFSQDYEYLKMNYKIVRSTMNSKVVCTPTTVRQIYGNLEVLGY